MGLFRIKNNYSLGGYTSRVKITIYNGLTTVSQIVYLATYS